MHKEYRDENWLFGKTWFIIITVRFLLNFGSTVDSWIDGLIGRLTDLDYYLDFHEWPGGDWWCGRGNYQESDKHFSFYTFIHNIIDENLWSVTLSTWKTEIIPSGSVEMLRNSQTLGRGPLRPCLLKPPVGLGTPGLVSTREYFI